MLDQHQQLFYLLVTNCYKLCTSSESNYSNINYELINKNEQAVLAADLAIVSTMYRKAAVIGKGLLSNRIRSLAVNHVRLHSYHVYNDSRRLLADPSSIKIDSSREAIAKYLPFTSEIITTKARSYDSIEVGYCDTCVQRNSNGDGKYIDDSWLQITLPFSRHALLRETLMRFDGETIRYGKLFEIFDALAGDVAYKHCGGLGHKLTIVTASVESMEIFTNLNVQRDVMLQGYLSYVGKSSMEVLTLVCD